MVASKDMRPVQKGRLTQFVQDQFCTEIPSMPKETDLTDQVAIVTGASSGLGEESARQLLTLGVSRLIIAVRSQKRGEEAVKRLQPANPAAKIEVWPLEMESYDSVRKFAKHCEREIPRMDIVILNAGVAEKDEVIVPTTRHEKTLQVNYLSTMLLAVLLLPVFRAKAKFGVTPHLTVVNSGMSSYAELPNGTHRPFLPSFDDPKAMKWDAQERYNASKLLGQFFLSRLADEVSSNDVIINMVEPGLIKGTELFRNVDGVPGLIFGLIKSIAGRPVNKGALTFLDSAVVKGRESHGSFVVNCRIAPLGPLTYGARGKSLSETIWKETLDEFEFVGAKNIISSMS